MTAPKGQAPAQEKIIGIVGGLGPYAHIDFERKLLESAQTLIGISSEQNYPEWVLSCIPCTPDRTEAILGNAPDPSPWLLRSLDVLERAGADFAVEKPGQLAGWRVLLTDLLQPRETPWSAAA